MRRDARLGRIGLTVLTALLLAAAMVLLVGEQNFLFTQTNRYFVLFPTVVGLAEGNPVQLNGVIVGKVEEIIMPQDMGEEKLKVWVSVERRYARRVRQDSVGRIKSLGLLGDKYVDITSGSPGFAEVPAGEEIPAAPPTDVDRLLASGGDVLDNVVVVADSLSKILTRMEAGEGLLGELLAERPDGEGVADSVLSTLDSIDQVAKRIERGEGTVGRLLRDEQLADDLSASLATIRGVADQIDEGKGLLAMLVSDPAARERFDSSLTSLESTMGELDTLANELRTGDGLLPRLLSDEEYGEQVSAELQSVLERLNNLLAKVDEGDGTVSRLINDPSIYQALDDIVVGINDTKILRWLIRSRQRKGIKDRVTEEDLQEVLDGASADG